MLVLARVFFIMCSFSFSSPPASISLFTMQTLRCSSVSAGGELAFGVGGIELQRSASDSLRKTSILHFGCVSLICFIFKSLIQILIIIWFSEAKLQSLTAEKQRVNVNLCCHRPKKKKKNQIDWAKKCRHLVNTRRRGLQCNPPDVFNSNYLIQMPPAPRRPQSLPACLPLLKIFSHCDIWIHFQAAWVWH